jgi:hypothetical protein
MDGIFGTDAELETWDFSSRREVNAGCSGYQYFAAEVAVSHDLSAFPRWRL